MGVKLKRIDELDDYRNQINQISKFHVERITVPWMFSDWSYNTFGKGKAEHMHVQEARNFTGSIIDKKKGNNSNLETVLRTILTQQKRNAMQCSTHCCMRSQIDAAGIQEEVDTFVFEGFDTTMTAITFMLLLIASHSDVQQCLYVEIQARNDKDDYKNLKFLDAVLKEKKVLVCIRQCLSLGVYLEKRLRSVYET